MLFDFYFVKFNFLRFISTPSNCLPICIWFYLRYKNKKSYTKLSVVLSRCFEDCKFPLSFSFSVFLLLLGRNLLSGYSPPIKQGSFACFSCCAYCIVWHWGILWECTLELYRVLRSISINIKIKYLLVLYKLIPLLSISKLVTSAL